MQGTPKDTITTIASYVIIVLQIGQLIYEAVMGYIQSVTDINWFQLIMVVALAVIGYFTGKTGDGKPKVVPPVQ